MDRESKSQTTVIAVAILAFVVGSFITILLRTPRTATDSNSSAALQATLPATYTAATPTTQAAARTTQGGREPVASVTSTTTATPGPGAMPGQGVADGTTATAELSATPSSSESTPEGTVVAMVQTAEPTTTPSPAPSGTAEFTTTGASPTSLPVPTAISTATTTRVTVASLDWPERLPNGMAFAAEDSWPFRVIAPDRENEPFLIFRNGLRWLLVRNHTGASEPVPRSATTQTLQFRDIPATLVKYLGGGFKLVLQRNGRAIQISGQDLSDEEIYREIVASLRPLSPEALRARLEQEAARQKFHVTLLWPNYLPDGIELAPAETIAQIVQPAEDPPADGYRVSFKGSDALIQVGGGTVDPPSLSGTQQWITVGSAPALLTVAQRRYLMVIYGGATSTHSLPRFPETTAGAPKREPLVQQGRVFIAADNIDREQFERVVANLVPVRPQEFAARARGQNTSSLTYLWPSTLPDGYSIDLNTVRIAWDDFLLQGGLPFFQLTATGPGDSAVTIKGGHEPGGEPFAVPEGGDVERTTTTIRGRTASAARTPDGSVLFWSEHDSFYSITSRSLTVEQLIAIGEGLQQVDADDFLNRIR